MKKVGIIRCQQTEDLCGGARDFQYAATGQGAFADFGPATVAGFVSCGGCPGKRAVARARRMVEQGAQAIFLASCMRKGTPMGMPCPHAAMIRKAVEKAVDGVPVIDWSH